ncbi:hypothetical protein EBZ39_04850 [bacterium]|nr:hypothetical protein [bacterium]
MNVRKSVKSYTDTATIQLPHRWYIKSKNGVIAERMPGDVVKEGDGVLIVLGYDGDLQVEFEGFVRAIRVSGELMMELECEGYSYQLRTKVEVTKMYKNGTNVKELLGLIAERTDISIALQEGCNIPFTRLKVTAATGCDIVEEIKKLTQGALNLYFVNAKTLWCGFTYSDAAKGVASAMGEVKYRLGYNCIKDNNLRKREITERVRLIVNNMGVTGDRIQTTAEVKSSDRRVVATLNNIGDAKFMKAIAEEVQNTRNYEGYEGKITGFLQPYCQPGWEATIVDKDYKTLTGKYLIAGTEVQFGQNGARRIVDIGPRIGFNSKAK